MDMFAVVGEEALSKDGDTEGDKEETIDSLRGLDGSIRGGGGGRGGDAGGILYPEVEGGGFIVIDE